jgi:uncharacterized protein YjbI with pentapeptide repeats
MANPEHLAILKKGVNFWNQWREETPEIIPDLYGVDLTKADLHRANFIRVDLGCSKLCGANLYGADLHGSVLNKVDFNNANLSRANFSEANFSRANLTMSDLYGANLTLSVLFEVDFSKAIVGLAVFADVNLSTVKGLETVLHQAPSTIGIDTLYKSQGKIPEIFLRGCGVPDQMIEYAKSLTNSPIQYYSCFISYSHKDEEFAQRVHADLQASNVRCWYAPHDMKIGDKIRPTIDESIRIHDKLLLILSKHSVESDWVEHEAEHALHLEMERKKGVLFPVRIDNSVMDSKTGWASNVRRQRHIGDFTKWKDHDAYKLAIDRLLRDLKA